ncbi:hypothetical protein CYMTET_37589 [Cymbomonas tetramitiformis]|uniref:Uncharacterized protein n=1 Tax=Cymbomonas tetramitiformis TaxID=36881 RepID=A0AAE0F6I6_9CHLO|nr:hypothetical protein CYMTET_37589 [Cymbomonas tetramitiformis]
MLGVPGRAMATRGNPESGMLPTEPHLFESDSDALRRVGGEVASLGDRGSVAWCVMGIPTQAAPGVISAIRALLDVTVTNVANNDSALFECNQWLDKSKGDKLVARELKRGLPRSSQPAGPKNIYKARPYSPTWHIRS